MVEEEGSIERMMMMMTTMTMAVRIVVAPKLVVVPSDPQLDVVVPSD